MEGWDGFELFVGGRGAPRRTDSPLVSIARNGTITVNRAANELWGDDVPDFVQLLYNAKNRTVVLLPVDEGEPGAYKYKPVANSNGSRSVTGKSFAEAYKITMGQKVKPRFEKNALLFEVS